MDQFFKLTKIGLRGMNGKQKPVQNFPKLYTSLKKTNINEDNKLAFKPREFR